LNKGISFSNVPGITFEYSNLGFALLGRIVTQVSGMPYQQYITENILKPLGMNDSKFEFGEVPQEKLAMGYRWEEEKWKIEPLLHDGSYGAMGGMLCSLEDFAKYAALHLSAWPPRNEADAGPVKRSSIREMHQPWRLNNLFADAKNRMGETCPSVVGYGYGLGWRKDCKGTVRISHSGGLPGFGSEWRIYPDYGVGVISFSNRTYGAPSPANAVALDTLIYMSGLKPRELSFVPLLEKTKELLMKMLPDWNEAEASAIFAENFFLDESVELRRAYSQKLFKEAGTIKLIGLVQPENQLRGQFLLECENMNISVFFTLTPEAIPLIQQLDLWVEERK
jgi:CubicO group peptidase (beta-lactamase class C family)